MLWDKKWKKKRTKVVLTECGNGIAQMHIKGNSIHAAAMLASALTKELNMIRAPEKTNEQIADNVRDMVLTGLYELEGKADDGK